MFRTSAPFVPGIQPQSRTFGHSGGGFVPTDIGGLVDWLPASFCNASTGTWSDQGGAGNDWTQAIGGSKPAVPTGVINGLPAVRFNGSSTYLNLPDLSALSAAHMFLVFKNASNGVGDGIFTLCTSSTDRKTYLPFSGNGAVYDSFFSNTRHDAIAAPALASGWHLYDVGSSASQWVNSVDGTQIFTTGGNTVSAPSAGVFGNASDNIPAAGLWYAGDVGEIIIYDHILSGADLTNVRNYLTGIFGPF